MIRYEVIPREEITFGGAEFRRDSPGRTGGLARSIEEHGLMLPPAVIRAGCTRGTEGMELFKGRAYVTLGGERRVMALGKGSTTPAAIITTWPEFLAWMRLDKELRSLFADAPGVLRDHTLADRDRFRSRALHLLGDHRPYTRMARVGIAEYFGVDPEELRSFSALSATAAGLRDADRQDIAAEVFPRVLAGDMTAMGALAQVARKYARRKHNGKPAGVQRDTIAAALVQLEAAARALDELGDISPEFPRDELAGYGDRLAKVRAKVTRASRSIRGEVEG